MAPYRMRHNEHCDLIARPSMVSSMRHKAHCDLNAGDPARHLLARNRGGNYLLMGGSALIQCVFAYMLRLQTSRCLVESFHPELLHKCTSGCMSPDAICPVHEAVSRQANPKCAVAMMVRSEDQVTCRCCTPDRTFWHEVCHTAG